MNRKVTANRFIPVTDLKPHQKIVPLRGIVTLAGWNDAYGDLLADFREDGVKKKRDRKSTQL
jgi:hypothetical protein